MRIQLSSTISASSTQETTFYVTLPKHSLRLAKTSLHFYTSTASRRRWWLSKDSKSLPYKPTLPIRSNKLRNFRKPATKPHAGGIGMNFHIHLVEDRRQAINDITQDWIATFLFPSLVMGVVNLGTLKGCVPTGGRLSHTHWHHKGNPETED